MGLSDQPFEVMCPDCGGMLKVDPVTRSVIAHTPAVRKKTFGDFGEAARALEAADARMEAAHDKLADPAVATNAALLTEALAEMEGAQANIGRISSNARFPAIAR